MPQASFFLLPFHTNIIITQQIPLAKAVGHRKGCLNGGVIGPTVDQLLGPIVFSFLPWFFELYVTM